jgi:hypothetical protein
MTLMMMMMMMMMMILLLCRVIFNETMAVLVKGGVSANVLCAYITRQTRVRGVS